jgi:GNAT superfamily N-acetyltransferase
MRLAFGTFRGLPNPMESMGDADYARTRWAADPASARAAEVDGVLVGTNFVTRWGSLGYFGPVSVLPSMWDRGVGRALLEATMSMFDDWGVTHRGLFAFGDSPKHVALYQSYGFLPRFLTSILAKRVSGHAQEWTSFSSLEDREQGLAEAAEVTASIAGRDAPSRFGRLLDSCEAFATASGVSTVTLGVSTGRRGAYRQLLDRGYRAQRIGVTMHSPDVDAYHHPEAYVIDDWR